MKRVINICYRANGILDCKNDICNHKTMILYQTVYGVWGILLYTIHCIVHCTISIHWYILVYILTNVIGYTNAVFIENSIIEF